MSSALVPAFAQQEEKPPVPNQPQITPVQPERPQQSEQSRQQDRKSAGDVSVGRDWKAERRDDDRTGRDDRMGRMNQDGMGRMNDRDDRDHRTVGRNWQMERDDGRGYEDRRGYYDEERPRVRIKICKEYENGDEVCRYRN